MGKAINSEQLGNLYCGRKTKKRREWRGLADTWYDYTRWLHNWKVMIGFMAKPANLKGFFRYRWMGNYLAVPDFIDRHTEGLRGPQLRIAHTEFDFIVEHVCETIGNLFRADPNCGNDQKFSKTLVVMDENMMTHVLNGFPNLKLVAREIPAIYVPSTVQQYGVVHYIDAAQQYGIPGDVCPMPSAELGVAIEDDYPQVGCMMLQCNTTCDGSLMGGQVEYRRFNVPAFQVAVPIRHMQESVQQYGADEIKNCIKWIEEQTGQKWDWGAYFHRMHTFNEETKTFCEWLDMSRTKNPQVIGNNVALYRATYYQIAGGKDDRFLENDAKINELARRAYKEGVSCVSEVRHRAIVWGVQAQYYTAFPLWLQNCWGILPLIDMLSLTSTKLYGDTDTPENREHAYLDMADLYMKMSMRNRSNGGYQVGVDDLWKFCEEYSADMVIMYEHIGCKSMAGYHGMFEDEARKRGIHLVWATHGLMDPRAASRADMRKEVSTYMRTVLHEEPLDPSLEEFDDANNW